MFIELTHYDSENNEHQTIKVNINHIKKYSPIYSKYYFEYYSTYKDTRYVYLLGDPTPICLIDKDTQEFEEKLNESINESLTKRLVRSL